MLKNSILKHKFLFLSILILVYFFYANYNITTDDSFISLRYAENLAEGQGLVYNPGEKVEGYSNFLWILLLSLCDLAGIDLLVSAKLLGLFFSVLTLIVGCVTARKHFEISEPLASFVPVLLAVSIGFVYYTLSGMETSFYIFQVLLLNFLLLEKRSLTASLVFCTLILTRPEGILLYLPLLAVTFFADCSSRKKILVLSLPILCAVLLTIFRLLYFGSLLPNPFYAKVGTSVHPLHFILFRVKEFVFNYMNLTQYSLNFAFALFFPLGLMTSLNRKFVAPVLSVLCLSFFVWFSGHDWMVFERFFVQFIPLMVLFALKPLSTLQNSLKGKGLLGYIPALVVISAIIFNGLYTQKAFRDLQRNRQYNPAAHSFIHIEVAKHLESIDPSGGAIAMNEIGAIGYYTKRPIVDIYGLIHKDIALLKQSDDLEPFADAVMERKPAFILVNNQHNEWDTEMSATDKILQQRALESGQYRYRETLSLNWFKKWLVYERVNNESDQS